MKHCLIVFAKEPLAGKVKTRLKGYLTESQCVDLYKAFLLDTIKLAVSIKCESRFIAFASDEEPLYLKSVAEGFNLFPQEGASLGDRMHNALEFSKSDGADKTVIIGTDAPTLPSAYIQEAFERLDKNDVVIGPARDGGYYLIGLKEPCEDLFKGISWSSEYVLTETIKTGKELKKGVSLLDEWYDIDTPEDVEYLKKNIHNTIAEHTKEFITSI